MPSLGAPELLIILVVVFIVFGAGKLPEVGKSLGQGIREFKKSSEGDEAAAPSTVISAAQAPAPATPVARATPTTPAAGVVTAGTAGTDAPVTTSGVGPSKTA